MISSTTITIAYGDGIGTEIMEATLAVLREAGARLTIETIEVGERIYNMGAIYGILPSAWEVLRRNKVFLKASIIIPETPSLPQETQDLPQDYSYKNLDVAIYEKFGLSEETKTISDLAIFHITPEFAMFEAKPEATAETTIIGMLQAAILMLKHIGQEDVANRISNAIQKVTEQNLNINDYAEALIARLWK